MKQTIYQKGWICNLRNPQGFRGCYKSTSANHKDRIGNQRVFVFVCIDLRTFGVYIDGMTGDFESGSALETRASNSPGATAFLKRKPALMDSMSCAFLLLI